MGGEDKENNLVLLTAREHFICHWLLVKRFEINTNERNKMLYAFWMMKMNPNNTQLRYINSRAYGKLRKEYVLNISKQMKCNQNGESNNQFGLHWFTNRNTGEVKKYKIAPNETWILGRNLFRGENNFIPFMKTYIMSISLKKWKELNPIKYNKKELNLMKKKIVYNIYTFEKMEIEENKIPEDFTENKQFAFHNSEKIKFEKLWDLFHSGNYSSLNLFSKCVNYTQPNLVSKFRKYIPIYDKITRKRINFSSNKNLIGVYGL